MSINLVPPDFWRFQMSKSAVTKLIFTFNWDSLLPAPQSTPSLGGIFRGTQNAPLDCDLVVLLLNSQAKLPDSKALVSFANPTSKCKSVQHLADNLSGNNHFNKQESLQVVLETLPAWVDS